MAAQQQPQQHQQYQQYQQQQYPQQHAYVPQQAPAVPDPLPPDVVTNWETVLNQLTGSKVGRVPFNRCQTALQATRSASARYEAPLGCCVSRSPPVLPDQGVVDESMQEHTPSAPVQAVAYMYSEVVLTDSGST